jgi:hypothetical protein
LFGGKTGQFPTVQIFHVVKRIPMFKFRVDPEPEPELNRDFGPVANII